MPTFSHLAVSFWALILLAVAATPLNAQSRETATVINASAVLDEVMRVPAKGIPRKLLSKAHGLVIIPGMLKGGFVVGVRHGRGVALTRNDKGGWEAPRFVKMSGGSIGYQIGVQSTDVILVFMTKKSVDGLLQGKFTIGADATAAAGPVGRQVAAATDGRLKAEILSYSRSRGLFAGVSIDGSLLQVDNRADRMFYGPLTDGQYAKFPESAVKLIETVSRYSALAAVPADSVHEEGIPIAESATPANTRQHLADAYIQLSKVLNDEWRRYFALPSEVFGTEGHPPRESLQRALDRFDKVARDPQYRVITERAEYQKTHALLREYFTSLTPKPSEQLPLPPAPKN